MANVDQFEAETELTTERSGLLAAPSQAISKDYKKIKVGVTSFEPIKLFFLIN